MVSPWMWKCGSIKHCPSAWLSLKLGEMELEFRSTRNPLNSASSNSNIQGVTLYVVYQPQLGKMILAIFSLLIFQNGYISAMWKRKIDLPTKSITIDRCSRIMTSVPVLTIWRRHCCMLCSRVGTILTVWQFLTYYLLLMNSELQGEHIVEVSTVVWTSHISAQYQSRYAIQE